MIKRLKIILVLISLVAVAGAGYYFLFSKPDLAGNTVADNAFGWKFPVTKFPLTGPGQVAYSDIRDPGGIPRGLPVRLKIPIIGVDSAIEDALITPYGRMDVPSGSVNVAWFALGPNPGQIGSAVIGGHFGIRNGIPFVFYNLDKLQVGDKVYIEDDEGNTLAFQVRSIKLFDRNADATTVFTSDDGLAHLNLITCEGIWNQVNGNYPSRRVVFTDAIAGGDAVAVNTTPSFQFNQILRIGASGVDVTALQTVLKQKGFLAISSRIDGSFGPITRSAVAKFQTSAGLQSDGIFGPKTRAKFASELAISPSIPVTGIETDVKNSSPSSEKTLTKSFKSLFSTPLDGIITVLLMISIIFLVFRIFL